MREYILSVIKRRFGYNPDSGEVYCLKTGRVYTFVETWGYIQVNVCGSTVKAHRIAFFLMTGRWPKIIDHVNRVKTDNRWCNLREVNANESQWNKGVQANNKVGLKGVSWHCAAKKWRAQIRVHGQKKHLGLFECPHDAAKAYDEAARTLHGEYAVLNFPHRQAA